MVTPEERGPGVALVEEVRRLEAGWRYRFRKGQGRNGRQGHR